MQIIKNIVSDKYFWIGLLLGFICGTLHRNFGL